MIRYKVVETSIVTDDVLEDILNEWTGKGWFLDGIHFVTSPSSSRPRMAYITFTSDERGTGKGTGEETGQFTPEELQDPE